MIDDVYAGYEAYITYLALKKHFSSDYDFFKYHGRIKASKDAFLKRRDRYFFQKIQKKHKNDMTDFMVANFIENEKAWIGTMAGADGEEIYGSWRKKQDSIGQLLKNECTFLNNILLENQKESWKDLVLVNDGNTPPLITLYNENEISIETLIILIDVLGFIGHWNKNLEFNPLWDELKTKLRNYRPFISYDREKCEEIIKNEFS